MKMKNKKEKPNCYKCKHRGGVSGDTHSCCNYPGTDTNEYGGLIPIVNKLNIKGNPHGVKHGWFYWPMNFDPVWLENCDGFEQKEKENIK